MGFLIDSSILFDAERGLLRLEDHIRGREDEEAFISVVSASELLHGVWRAKTPAIRARRSAFVEAAIERFPLLTIDLACARVHAQVQAEMEERGQLVGPHDLWLASTCLAHGLSLITGNLREFERVPGLRVERWG
jgi:tRNA(fMet)-specific endonuclease VapC